MKASLFAFLFLFTHSVAFADLRWDRKRIELTAKPLDTVVEATFTFENTGSTTVTIEHVKSSCGCTTAALPKMTFEPGEKSQLNTKFDITGRRGQQTKTVALTIRGESQPVVLELAVTIPDLLTVNPGIVVWERGEPATPKKISLKAMQGESVRVVKVDATAGRVSTALETVREGAEYVVVVTPNGTSSAGFAVLNIETEFKDQKKTLRAYAQVRDTRR